MGAFWILPMFAAGACSAGAIVLIRDLDRYAPGLPTLLAVGIYMLLGGAALLAVAGVRANVASVVWPGMSGCVRVAAIGLFLAALEAFFVVGGRGGMPLPDAMIVYNLTSLSLVTLAAVLMFGEVMTLPRILGLALGLASVVLLLQPASSTN